MSPASFCAHCKSPAKHCASRWLDEFTLREIRYTCSNPECGHTYIAYLETVSTISPSAIPNPKVVLPLSKRSHARMNAYAQQLAQRGLITDELTHK